MLLSPVRCQDKPNEYCREDMSVCSCPKSEVVCYFKFAIQRLITFTRYENGSPTGYGGKPYFINDTGQLERVPIIPTPDQGCSETNCSQANTADSTSYRTFIGINGHLPGPTLVVYQNQTIVVEVVNMLLTEVTTIHWHGLAQFNTPWMDGAGTVSQCPIEPGTSFTYIFNVSCAGTFWYHSHSGAQRSEGLFGGLVVKNDTKNEEYEKAYNFSIIDTPEDHTLTLLDWQREESVTLFWKDLSKLRYFPEFGVCPDEVPTSEDDFPSITQAVDGSGVGTWGWWAGLINGMGRQNDVPLSKSRLSVFTVQQDKTYRFRLIGVQSVYAFRFSIDGHRLTVIATDSFLTQPQPADYIIIHSGERYDFLLTANQTGQNDYWMRAETLEAQINFKNQLPPYEPFPGHYGLGVLHYDGTSIPVGPDYEDIANITRPCSMENKCIAVNCPFENYNPAYNITCVNANQLKLFEPVPLEELPSEVPDEDYFMIFGFENKFRTGTINARNFIPYKVSPSIQPNQIPAATLCNLGDDCVDSCLCTHQLNITYNKTIRFIFSSAGRSPDQRRFTHPVHLHGHEFQVVGVGYGEYNDSTGQIITPTKDIVCDSSNPTNVTCVKPAWSNGTGPPVTINQYTIRKDTILVPALGYIIIHFRSTNPGWWFLHCHMEPHQLEGMAMVINEAPERQPPPPTGMQTCGNFTWTVKEFREATRFKPKDDAEDLTPGAIAGIVIACVVVVVLIIIVIIVIIFCVVKRSESEDYDVGTQMKSKSRGGGSDPPPQTTTSM